MNSTGNRKIAMVTGSSSGIGKAIALHLAGDGFDVILHGRSPSERIEQTKQELEQTGATTTAVFGDFSQTTNWDDFVGQAWNWKGHIDVWVNNAGGDVLTGEWSKRSFEQKLDYLLSTDVKSTLMLSRAIGTRMANSASERTAPCSIINIGWDQAAQGMAGDSGEMFATTKGAIMAMTKSLAQSLAPDVRVNCVAPGWIKTAWGVDASDTWQQRARSDSLMKRWGTPSDIAATVAFLASEKASFISGQIIPVNGGFRFEK